MASHAHTVRRPGKYSNSALPTLQVLSVTRFSITPLHVSVQLLGELLLDRANVKVMMRYVSDSKNLQMMMMLLKDNSRSIQFEAFHVFKVPSLLCATFSGGIAACTDPSTFILP